VSAVISVERVSKAYRLGTIGSGTLGDDVARWWARVRHKPDPLLRIGDEHHARRVGDQFWALEDLTFDVKQGEVLGIIGKNGAGKSTLLKILSQVTAPTSGLMRFRGRIASLLEVGTGFHPELTGRENIFLNGAILGMNKAEIRSKLDEIVEFSEIAEFVDTPVKRYSSGMYVRLAFAVAAHLEPEILILDEVLAVGDARFQQKCLGKMGEVSQGGRTVLFVSHNMVAVQSLCRRALLLRDGRLEREGPAASVVSAYLGEGQRTGGGTEWATPDAAPGNAEVRIKSVRITPGDRRPDGLISMITPIHVETEFWLLKPHVRVHLVYHVINEQGVVVLTTACQSLMRPVGLHRGSVTLPGQLLNSGAYSLRLYVIQDENRGTYDHQALASFTVNDLAERTTAWAGREPGVVRVRLPWTEIAVPSSDAPSDARE
jgi:lipopolysaccharide transport system ATP-binding protein